MRTILEGPGIGVPLFYLGQHKPPAWSWVHPLKIETVAETIFKHVDMLHIPMARLVCRTWRAESDHRHGIPGRIHGVRTRFEDWKLDEVLRGVGCKHFRYRHTLVTFGLRDIYLTGSPPRCKRLSPGEN